MKIFNKTVIPFSLSVFLFYLSVVPALAQEPQIAKNTTPEDTTVSNSSIVNSEDNEDASVKPAVNENSSGSALKRVGVQAGQTVPLSLNEAIRKALENNNTIEVARTDVRFQETQLRSLLGNYDPVFSILPTYRRNSTTGSTPTNDFNVNSDVSGFIKPGGGNYSLFFNNSRTENRFAQTQF